MQYKKITKEMIEELRSIVGGENIITEKDEMEDYAHDEMAHEIAITHYPDIVVKPDSTEKVSRILRLANANRIPVTPRGAGTGLSGGCAPIFGGIVLSLELFDDIIEVDEDNLMITAGAGVPLMKIYETLKATNLFFPLHPGDESAYIGGAVATNAGGVRAVKYGVMRNYVKGAEVVLPNGEVLNLGGKLLKNNTGYNLLQLLIGSEGTLGIFTKVTLRLLPKPKEMMILLLPYDDAEDAISTVSRILRSGIIPLGMEYIERPCIEATEDLLAKSWPAREGEAFLMIVVVGDSKEELYSKCEEMAKIGKCPLEKALLADTEKKQQTIMDLRGNIYEALKPETLEILDIGVPPNRIAEFVNGVKEMSKEHDIDLPVYGHAADGNIHIHIMKTGLSKEAWREKYTKVKTELFKMGKEMGGVITAEHGVGAQKIGDLCYTLSEEEIRLMKRIKEVFDPNNILNPGKVVPELINNVEEETS